MIPFFAQQIPSLLPGCTYSGNCGLCDIIDVIGRGFEFMLFFLGIAIFAVFIGGGACMIWARGRSELIEQGKNMLQGALYGGLVVLVSWQLINMVIWILVSGAISGTNPTTGGNEFILFNANPWNKICEGQQANISECFSRGDGSACESGSKHCVAGACEDGPACEYLVLELPQYFGNEGPRAKAVDENGKSVGPYGCVSSSNSSQYDECLTNLCPTGQLCCGNFGTIQEPATSPPTP